MAIPRGGARYRSVACRALEVRRSCPATSPSTTKPTGSLDPADADSGDGRPDPGSRQRARDGRTSPGGGSRRPGRRPARSATPVILAVPPICDCSTKHRTGEPAGRRPRGRGASGVAPASGRLRRLDPHRPRRLRRWAGRRARRVRASVVRLGIDVEVGSKPVGPLFSETQARAIVATFPGRNLSTPCSKRRRPSGVPAIDIGENWSVIACAIRCDGGMIDAPVAELREVWATALPRRALDFLSEHWRIGKPSAADRARSCGDHGPLRGNHDQCAEFSESNPTRTPPTSPIWASTPSSTGARKAPVWRRGTSSKCGSSAAWVRSPTSSSPGCSTASLASAVIGHTRYSTAGTSVVANAQPVVVATAVGPLAIVHNGNLSNGFELRRELEKSEGSIFQTTSDTEVILHLMARNPTAERGRVVDGGARTGPRCLLAAAAHSADGLIAARDPHGFRPLLLGDLDGAHVLRLRDLRLRPASALAP